VAQGVHRGTRGVPTGLEGHPEGILHTGAGHRGGCRGHADAAPAWSGEAPQGMAGRLPVLTQACQALEYSSHACTHRHGPTCHNDEATRWLDTQRERRLPVPYVLVTFTLPEALRP
jgi:hypothetical protein